MSEDKRDPLGILRYELNLIEQGGYGKRFGTFGASSIFEDSLTCPNHGDPICRHGCHECLLYDFVPEEHRTDDIPCHHIPLNRSGVTVSTPNQTQDEIRNNVVHWLKRTITRMETESINMSRAVAAGGLRRHVKRSGAEPGCRFGSTGMQRRFGGSAYMKILYVSVAAGMTETPDLLKDVLCVISVNDFCHALKLIQMEAFDALVIDEGDMHPGTLDFISDARRLRPELPICVASAWGADLPMALQTLEALAPPAEVY